MGPFTVPRTTNGQPVPRRFWSVDQLQDHLSNLETLQEQIISSQVQHLNELATLNRMATALAERRSYDEVINDTLQEVYLITDCAEAWVVDAADGDAIAAVHCLNDPVIGRSTVCKPVERLCRRIHESADGRVVYLPAGAGSDAQGQPRAGAYLGFPILTNRHLLGALVMHCSEQRDITRDEHVLRLIQSMLRQTAVACENDRLVEAVGKMMIECVYGFAQSIESRDPYTGGHVQRVTAYALLLAKTAGLSPRDRAIIQIGGLLHDIGKIAIPDAVLRKPGRLEPAEFEIIKQHPVVGFELIRQIPHLGTALAAVRHHHERWDGKGYPDGLKGEDIPLHARVLAVADAFDAMTSDRPYRPGLPFDVAMDEVRKNAGVQFDAELATCFLRLTSAELEQAAAQMSAWCQGHAHPGLGHVTDLLDLDMKRLPQVRRKPESTWDRPVLDTARTADQTMMGDVIVDQAEQASGLKFRSA